MSPISSDNHQHISANPEFLFPSSGNTSTLFFSVPVAKSQSSLSQPGNIKTSHKDSSLKMQASKNVCLMTTPEPKSTATSVPVSESPILHTPPPPRPASPYVITLLNSSVSLPKTSSLSAVLPELVEVTTKPLSPRGPEASALEPLIDDALDNLYTMNFSNPESQSVATSVCQMKLAEQQEVFEGTFVAVDRSVVQPDMHTESEAGDGLLEDQSDCRSEFLDWADMELKLSYDGADGSMTPVTEASWMDDSLTPSSCPGTPDAQMDLPTLHPVSTMDRVSASGHV